MFLSPLMRISLYVESVSARKYVSNVHLWNGREVLNFMKMTPWNSYCLFKSQQIFKANYYLWLVVILENIHRKKHKKYVMNKTLINNIMRKSYHIEISCVTLTRGSKCNNYKLFLQVCGATLWDTEVGNWVA